MRSTLPLFAAALLVAMPALADELVPVPQFRIRRASRRRCGDGRARTGSARHHRRGKQPLYAHLGRPGPAAAHRHLQRACPREYRLRVVIQSPDSSGAGGEGRRPDQRPPRALRRSGNSPWRSTAAAGSTRARLQRRASRRRSTAAANCWSVRAAACRRRSMAAAMCAIGAIRRSARPSAAAGTSPPAIEGAADLHAVATELQPDRQKRTEGVVAARPRMEGVEEQLRLAVQARRNRGMAGRRPLARRAEQRLALLGVRSERMIGDRDADAV